MEKWRRNIFDCFNYRNAGFIHANAISVSGNDVYIAGYGISPGGVFPQLLNWKNDVIVPVNKIDGGGRANSILVSGGDVYIAGMQQVSPDYTAVRSILEKWKCSSASIQCRWFPLQILFLSQAIHVYLAGEDVIAYQMSYAVYWKDGVETKLTDGTHGASANSIVVK